MYTLYKIFSKLSKFLSNAFVVISIPISIILVAGLTIVIFLKEFLSGIGVWGYVHDALASNDKLYLINTFQIVAIVILGIIVLCWLIFIIAWCLKKYNFKKIGEMNIARNKEYRNNDINEYKERLEKYRYRD